MALLTPNATYKMNGVTVNEKIIPDGTVWKNATKAKKAGSAAGKLYKKQKKLSGGTGKAQSVTIHNTNDLVKVHDDGEQYTRATYNENMNLARVHFYVDDVCAWQNLKAGTGLCDADPIGSAEVSWHAGDGSTATGGNITSLSIEIIMNDNADHDAKARDNGARVAAWLLWKHGLSIKDLVTHTYWVNKKAGNKFDDVDEQCCNRVSGKKWCPAYIFGSTNEKTALANWKAFKALVQKYLDILEGKEEKPAEPQEKPKIKVDYAQDKDESLKGTYVVKSSDGTLNLRAGAGTDKALIETMKNGQEVRCYGWHTDKWLYVVAESGKVGFCHSGYLVKQK